MTKQYKYVCDCGKYKSNSFIGYKTHYAMMHPDKEFPLKEQEKPQVTQPQEDIEYPDFLFSSPKVKEIFLYLHKLNDDNPEQCQKAAIYLYEQYPDIVSQFGQPDSPLFLENVSQRLQDVVQYQDKVSALKTQVQKYTDNLTKMREEYNSLQADLQNLENKKQLLADIETQLQEEGKQLKLIQESVNYKKITKTIVDINEIIDNDFIYNNLERFYILKEDKYKDLQYLLDRLVLIYNKK